MTVVVTEQSESDDSSADSVEDAISDIVMDSTTIQLVERVTRLEDQVTVLTASLQVVVDKVSSLEFRDDMQEHQIEHVQEVVSEVAEEVEEIAEGVADAVTDVVEEVDAADEDITPDEVPSIREHPFFRKWRRS